MTALVIAGVDYPAANDTPLLALLGIGFTAIPYVLITRSLKHIRAHEASLALCLEPVYGIILAFIVLREQVDLKTLYGGLIIIGVTIVSTWWDSRKDNK